MMCGAGCGSDVLTESSPGMEVVSGAPEPTIDVPPIDSRFSSGLVDPALAGGSNYVMIDIGRYETEPTNEVWFTPGELQPTIATYHRNVARVREHLRAMIKSGQEQIALVAWYGEIFSRHGIQYGHVIDASDGMVPQHRQNLVDLVDAIAEAGYGALTVRFATQGVLSPKDWERWEPDLYEKSWVFIEEAKRVASERARIHGIAIQFDLALERGGIETGETRRFTRELIQDYMEVFGHDGENAGASLAFNRGRLERYIDDVRAIGFDPPAYHLDIYKDVYAALRDAHAAMRNRGAEQHPIVIQETYSNDPAAARDIAKSRLHFGLNIQSVFQWPLERASDNPHFSQSATVAFDSYLEPCVFEAGAFSLRQGESIACNGMRVSMQRDGNFVLYERSESGPVPRWSTRTNNRGSVARFQSDGNFVIYTPSGVPAFSTATNGSASLSITELGQLEFADAVRTVEFPTEAADPVVDPPGPVALPAPSGPPAILAGGVGCADLTC
ncbi:MAG: hypothetical protein AAF658_16880, partial [Myxococcota bacterium]